MKLSKIKLLDLISNAPRANKKKYIKNAKSNGIGENIKVDDIDKLNPNDYNVGTIAVDKFCRMFICQPSYILYMDPDETLGEIQSGDPEYKSNFNDTFIVDGVEYRRWYESDGENEDKHYIIITKETYVKEAYADVTQDNPVRFNTFIRAIAAGQYGATLEDETTLEYIGADATSKTLFAGDMDAAGYLAWTIRSFSTIDDYYGVIKQKIYNSDEYDYYHIFSSGTISFGGDPATSAYFISDKDLQEIPELAITEDTIFFDFNDFECKELKDGEFVFTERINKIDYDNAIWHSSHSIIAKQTNKRWTQVFLSM